jgi:hypothetical protein
MTAEEKDGKAFSGGICPQSNRGRAVRHNDLQANMALAHDPRAQAAIKKIIVSRSKERISRTPGEILS